MGAKPFQVRPHYHLIYGPDWHEHEDGHSINSELLQRIKLLVDYLFEHQMVTGNIRFNEGVRSPRRAHIMSTSWFLRQSEGQEPSKIPLRNLRALPGGRDLDGNPWYDPKWDSLLVAFGLPPESPKDIVFTDESLNVVWNLIRKRAEEIKPQNALAAEGYAFGDDHILPNVYPTISNHVGGNAIDCTIPWRRGAEVVKYAGNRLTPPNPWGLVDTHPVAKMYVTDGGTEHGLNDPAANFVVAHFGLCRPVNRCNPKTCKGVEPWHFQLDPYRKPLYQIHRSH